MARGATYIYGFVGEYPWGTAYNLYPDEWYGLDATNEELGVPCVPAWNDIAVEWEYDASLPENFHMHVPAKAFFEPGDLWWNGRDGFRRLEGKTVFKAPSVQADGPGALIAEAADLEDRLRNMESCIVWTLLCEKRVMGGNWNKERPGRTFSLAGLLVPGKPIQLSDWAVFEDFQQSTGPAPRA